MTLIETGREHFAVHIHYNMIFPVANRTYVILVVVHFVRSSTFESAQLDNFNSRIASPAPLRLASRISEYLRDKITPGAPAWKAARTASFTLWGVRLLLLGSVGISISMPGHI